jgi:Glycosyl hydrolase family 12
MLALTTTTDRDHMKKLLIALGAALCLLGLIASAASAAGASVRPAVGVSTKFNKPMCGTNDWERIKLPNTELAVIDSSKTCVESEKYHATFNVSDVLENKAWQFPAMIAGYVPTGEPTCASSKDTCYTFPVQQKSDGAPLVSFDSWIAGGYQGNQAMDIWLSPVKSHHSISERAGDTELMIWTAWPGLARPRLVDDVTIDGKQFGIMTWIANHDSQNWRYIAYLWLNAPNGSKGRAADISGLYLNPFFRNAESHGWLKSSDWLWSIATGFEMNHGGRTNNIHNYSLTGLPS